MKVFIVVALLFYAPTMARGQGGVVRGLVSNLKDDVVPNAHVALVGTSFTAITDANGIFSIQGGVMDGEYAIAVSHVSYSSWNGRIRIKNGRADPLTIHLEEKMVVLQEVVVQNAELNEMSRRKSVDGVTSYVGKKNEVISMDLVTGNVGVNNARQIFGKIAGLNFWENDGSGLQMNISTRGLSPNRSWEFNVRQDGSNVQADVLGYPDTYYSPTMDAVSKIEVIRGSASLQYGTQLGGMIDFKIKRSSESKPIEVEAKQTFGSYNLHGSYNSIGGKTGNLSYFAYYHNRGSDGWRENSDYDSHTYFGSVKYQPQNNFKVELTYTSMNYLLHLAAGLTDSLFYQDPRQSVRNRNWFKVNWNLPTMNLEYRIRENIVFTLNSSVILGNRNSVEFTKSVNIPDDNSYRDTRKDAYRNLTTEARLRVSTNFSDNISNVTIAGVRFYKGLTLRKQGWGTNGSDANFSFINPDSLEYNDYRFRTNNIAVFVESCFRIKDALSISPGIRLESIDVYGDGYYNYQGTLNEENVQSNRSFPLLGLGVEYEATSWMSVYGSIAQGFRAVLFNDIRIENPIVKVDPNLKDSKGFNADAGVRGIVNGLLNFDVSLFYLAYNDRIGVATYVEPSGTTQLKTNIADSRNIGLESMLEVNLLRVHNKSSTNGVSPFISYSTIDAKYVNSVKDLFVDKSVEYVARDLLRCGLSVKFGGFRSSAMFSFVGQQFSDANNTIETTTGTEGIIKPYSIVDWSTSYTYKYFSISVDLNNALNNSYFTRRAGSYPGPGLIPAEPRMMYVSFGIKL